MLYETAAQEKAPARAMRSAARIRLCSAGVESQGRYLAGLASLAGANYAAANSAMSWISPVPSPQSCGFRPGVAISFLKPKAGCGSGPGF